MARVTTTRSQILIRPMGTTVYRRQHFLDSSSSHSSRGRIAEVAGGTAAECAAVFCCCPCTLVNLVVLAVYKLPAGICRKALKRHKRQRMIKQGLFPLSSSTTSSEHGACRCHSWDQDEFHMGLASVPEDPEVTMFFMEGNEVDNELMELEKQMWEKFTTQGFGEVLLKGHCDCLVGDFTVLTLNSIFLRRVNEIKNVTECYQVRLKLDR